MAFPTAVNSQITDAITQANVKVIAESPAIAMGQIYQSLAHATGILFEDAVSAQQQLAIAAQAATNQGVIQIYSVDTTAGAAATGKIVQSDVPDNMLSLLTALHASGGGAPKATVAPEADTTPATDVADASAAGAQGIAPQVRDAVVFANDTVLGSNATFVAGHRAVVDAMAHALEAIERTAHENRFHVLQEAALAATFAAMLREPEKAKAYEAVLQVIQRMA